MKKLMTTLVGLVVSINCMASELLYRACEERPIKSAWIVTIEKDGDQYSNDYCYAGPQHDYLGFKCDINGEVAKTGDEVLGYTDYVCTDIGHLPGYFYKWVPKFIPVKILP